MASSVFRRAGGLHLLRSILWGSGLAIALLTQANPAAAKVVTRQEGSIRATVSYDEENRCPDNTAQVVIERGDRAVLNRTIEPGACRLMGAKGDGLMIRDLDADGEPEIILDWYSGGAHCCFFSLVYRYNSATDRYEDSQKSWAHTSYELRDMEGDRVPEFYSANNSFAYQFASFAESAMPVQIWRYDRGQFLDVTRQYPNEIYNDAFQWWQAFQGQQRTCVTGAQDACGEGFLAAYVATKALLNQSEDAWMRVRQAYRGDGCTLDGCRGREALFQDVRQFLLSEGYLTEPPQGRLN